MNKLRIENIKEEFGTSVWVFSSGLDMMHIWFLGVDITEEIKKIIIEGSYFKNIRFHRFKIIIYDVNWLNIIMEKGYVIVEI